MPVPSIGSHVDQADPVAEGRARGADLIQIFLGDPQSYKGPVVQYEGGPEALRIAVAESGMAAYVHAPYLINVATTNNRIRIPSRKLLQQHVDMAARIGARGVVVHGGHVSDSDQAAVGFDNWRKCIEQLDAKVPVLIENTAGGDNAMARRMERIGRLWEAVSKASGGAEIGFCLDTCHAHAGGNELTAVVAQVRALVGRIDLVHANDSRDEFDSGADRHANLGAGRIPQDDLVAVVTAAGAPVVVETPGGAAEQGADIAWLRERL